MNKPIIQTLTPSTIERAADLARQAQESMARDFPSAPGLLDAAHRHMLERAATYDQPQGERSVAAIVTAFNAITRRDDLTGLSEAEGWLFLQLLKQVRLFAAPGFHRDSAEDNIAYAALLGEAKAREVDPR